MTNTEYAKNLAETVNPKINPSLSSSPLEKRLESTISDFSITPDLNGNRPPMRVALSLIKKSEDPATKRSATKILSDFADDGLIIAQSEGKHIELSEAYRKSVVDDFMRNGDENSKAWAKKIAESKQLPGAQNVIDQIDMLGSSTGGIGVNPQIQRARDLMTSSKNVEEALGELARLSKPRAGAEATLKKWAQDAIRDAPYNTPSSSDVITALRDAKKRGDGSANRHLADLFMDAADNGGSIVNGKDYLLKFRSRRYAEGLNRENSFRADIQEMIDSAMDAQGNVNQSDLNTRAIAGQLLDAVENGVETSQIQRGVPIESTLSAIKGRVSDNFSTLEELADSKAWQAVMGRELGRNQLTTRTFSSPEAAQGMAKILGGSLNSDKIRTYMLADHIAYIIGRQPDKSKSVIQAANTDMAKKFSDSLNISKNHMESMAAFAKEAGGETEQLFNSLNKWKNMADLATYGNPGASGVSELSGASKSDATRFLTGSMSQVSPALMSRLLALEFTSKITPQARIDFLELKAKQDPTQYFKKAKEMADKYLLTAGAKGGLRSQIINEYESDYTKNRKGEGLNYVRE